VPLPDIIYERLEGEFWGFQKNLTDGHLTVIAAKEPPGWHLSISHRTPLLVPGRYPVWDEIKEARYLFMPPDITMAQLLPPVDEFVNIHETTFHLWEVPNDVWS
jgi:hypothetical protein